MIRQKNTLMVSLLLAVFVLGLVLPVGTALADEKTSVKGGDSQFSDLGSDNSNLVYINYVTAKGIMGGFPDGSFHPGEGLTRAQGAVIISKAANLTVNDKATGFKDVASGYWGAGYIAAAVKAGYLKGMPDGTFRPEDYLTRAQGVSLVLRLSKQADPGTALPEFTDMSTTHWAARSMAIAIDAGMIDAPNGNSIQPDSPVSRGDISQALAILLTSDPDLNKRVLYSTITVKHGMVKLTRGSGEAKLVADSVPVGAGDTIVTGQNGEAVINYPDGSSLLLNKNSTLTIKESQGRAYIKKDGQPGTAVDNLEVELAVGEMFGGLSSLAQPNTEGQTGATGLRGSRLLASNAEKHTLLAAGGTPWYKTAQQQKVKVKVDMPWGVAAIRGSFWNSFVNGNGSGGTNLLEGSASVIAGGQTVGLSPGQSTSGSSSGGPPSQPAAMTNAQLGQWAAVSSWVQSTFNSMSSNQGSGMPGSPGTPGSAPDPGATLGQALNQAMGQANQAAENESNNVGNENNSGHGGSGGSTGDTITVTGIPSEVLLPLEIPGPTANVAGSGSCQFTVNPAGATITQVSSGLDVVDVIVGNCEGTIVISLTTKGSVGTELISLTFTKSGYTSVTKTLPVTVVPLLSSDCNYKLEGFSVPLDIQIINYDGAIWNSADTLSADLIDLNTGESIAEDIYCCNDEYYLTVTLNTSLDRGIYGIVAKKGTNPIGMSYLKVTTVPAKLNGENDVVNDGSVIYMPLTFVDPDWWGAAMDGNTIVTINGQSVASGWILSNPDPGCYYLVLDPDTLAVAGAYVLQNPGTYAIRITAESYESFPVQGVQTIAGVPDTTPPAITSISGGGFSVKIYFDEPVLAGSGNVYLINKSDENDIITLAPTGFTFVPDDFSETYEVSGVPGLQLGPTEYWITVDGGAFHDSAGNPCSGVNSNIYSACFGA